MMRFDQISGWQLLLIQVVALAAVTPVLWLIGVVVRRSRTGRWGAMLAAIVAGAAIAALILRSAEAVVSAYLFASCLFLLGTVLMSVVLLLALPQTRGAAPGSTVAGALLVAAFVLTYYLLATFAPVKWLQTPATADNAAVLPKLAALLLLVFTVGCSNGSSPPQVAASADQPPPVRYDGPPLPFEDAGACPFEGCTYREWTTNATVKVLTARDDTAPVAFELPAGTRVTALTGVVVTVVPGIVELPAPAEVETNEGTVPMKAGEVFYLLTYQGEGFGKVWIKGGVRTDVDLSRFKPKRGPTAIWWVQVRNARGQIGWTRHPEAFDGKDRHA